jgi:outer membrane protein TolC
MRLPLVRGALLVFTLALAAAQTTPPAAPVQLTLADALARARRYSQQVYSADIAARLAHEDTVQTRAGLLPQVSGFSQFIYTQPNGTPSGVFVSNDGPHVYNDQVQVHGELLNLARRADYLRAVAAEAVARARADLASRGLVATVTQDYYGVVVAQRKVANAEQSLRETGQLVAITRKLETGGEAAHADVVKAEIQLEQRERDLADAHLALSKASVTLAVLIFPVFGQPYSVTDDLAPAPPLPSYEDVRAMAAKNNPEIRMAEAALREQRHGMASARAALLPSLSFDYFFGINANQFALYNRERRNNLGSVAQVQLNLPIWTWGAARSKVRQAQLQVQLAENDLSLAQRTLLAEEQSFYLEAETAGKQVASLARSSGLSADSLRLTIDRYEAGEATVLELVDAQSTAAAARNAYDDGLLRYRLALANLQTLTGTF